MEKAMELIEQLANQLGVAVEYLWSTLVRQHFAEGITDIILAVLGIVMIILLAIYTPKLTRGAANRYTEKRHDRITNGNGYLGSYIVSDSVEDLWSALRFAIPICAVIFGIIMFAEISTDITTGIQKLINPDYFALKEILDVIGSAQ